MVQPFPFPQNVSGAHDARLGQFFGDLHTRIEHKQGEYKEQASRTQASLNSFFAALGPVREIAANAQTRLDRHAATSFSVFHYFHERETDLSRIFAGLLDPAGADGQGDLFLSLFLKELQRTEKASDEIADSFLKRFDSTEGQPCSVWTEYSVYWKNRRRSIDIVLSLSRQRWIGIENKPWAGEQDDQVEAYLRALLPKSPDQSVLLVYLSGSGASPTTAPTSEEYRRHCVTMSYRDYRNGRPSLEHWIQRCYEKCEAERVRWFLKDVLEYVQRSFADRSPADVHPSEERSDSVY